MSSLLISAKQGRVLISASLPTNHIPLKGGYGLVRGTQTLKGDKIWGVDGPVSTHTLPLASIGKEVQAVDIGKPEKEITIEPIEQPKRDPVPAEPTPAPTPEKVPAGV